MTRPQIIFLVFWSLYVLSMFISMLGNREFILPEALFKTMLTVMFSCRMSRALLLITLSRTAIAVFIVVNILQLIHINLRQKSGRQKKRFFITLGAVLVGISIIFFRPIYRFFTEGSITAGGVDLNRLISGRYEPWMHILNNMSWFGEGSDYIDFTQLLRVHNIFLDTLGRYGMVTTVLLVALLGLWLVMSVRMGARQGFNFGLFVVAFVLIGMFEYNYLFMFVYFSPVVLLFVVGSGVVGMRERETKIDERD